MTESALATMFMDCGIQHIQHVEFTISSWEFGGAALSAIDIVV
jgi:hypothetical protein